MSGEVVSLNRARKQRKRAEDAATAAANRVQFGRTKLDKSLTAGKADLTARRLEGHRLEKVPEVPES